MLDRYEFGPAEVELLVEAARTLSTVEGLEKQVRVEGSIIEGPRGGVKAHPALVELRHQRATLGRLLAQLDLPDEDAVDSPATVRARKAANSRWTQHRQRMQAQDGAG